MKAVVTWFLCLFLLAVFAAAIFAIQQLEKKREKSRKERVSE